MNPNLTLRQRLGMCWLMLALVLSPALGLVHQVVHAHGLPSHADNVALASAQPTTKHALDTIHALFAGHSKAECVLLDQVAMGPALLVKPLPLFQALPTSAPVVDVSALLAGQHATPFQARGPPSSQKA